MVRLSGVFLPRTVLGAALLAASLLGGRPGPTVAQADLVGCRTCPHSVSLPPGHSGAKQPWTR